MKANPSREQLLANPRSCCSATRLAAAGCLLPAFARGLLAVFALVAAPCGAAATDLTFFFTADTHYGLDLWIDNEPGNKATIDAMNNLPGTPYPAAIGGVVDTPQGVLVAGDLTDTPEFANAYGFDIPPSFHRDGFTDDYAVDGSGRLHYPVYEGYGNHDVDNTDHSYTIDAVRERNLVRPGISHLSDNGLNYSWDWQGVHFVNLNIYAGMNDRSAFSLAFLLDDLQNYVGNPQTPVVIMQHFGFDSFSLTWWTPAERQAFADAIAGYNILGIFHGHLHTTSAYEWNGYDVFDGSAAKDGNFLVAHITNDRMTVAARVDDHWGFQFSKTVDVPEPSTFVLALVAACGAWVLARRQAAA